MINLKKASFVISLALVLGLLCSSFAFASNQTNSTIASNSTNSTHVIPLSSDATQCYFISNLTVSNTQNFNLAAIPVSITLDSIGPLAVNLTVNNVEYKMQPGQLQIFANQSGRIYTISLGAITYTSTQQSVNVNLCSIVSTTTSSSTIVQSNTTNSSAIASNVPSSSTGTAEDLFVVVFIIAALFVAITYINERREKKKSKQAKNKGSD